MIIKEEQQRFSIQKRRQSFVFALAGLKVFFKTQHNAWIHFAAMILVVIAGFFFHISVVEWCFISLASGLVLVAEIINTSIEFLTDIVSPAYNEKAGIVKDLAAGAVLLAAIIALIVGLFIFLPKVAALLHLL